MRPTIETKTWMFVTSKDLREMADIAESLEKGADIGDSLTIKEWNCGDWTTVKLVIDVDRAKESGLME